MNFLNDPAGDFEQWAALAKSDPEAFEEKRRAIIAQFIGDAPPHRQARLQGLQWRIDVERGRYRHPLMSSVHLFNKMWTSVYGEGGLVDALQGNVEAAEHQAAVLPFKSVRSEKSELAARS